jgi:hypothetical protein
MSDEGDVGHGGNEGPQRGFWPTSPP